MKAPNKLVAVGTLRLRRVVPLFPLLALAPLLDLGCGAMPASTTGQSSDPASSNAPACGATGQPCCAGGPACRTGLFCGGSACIQGTCSGRDPRNAQWFRLGVRTAFGCAVTVVSEWASSLVEAELCAGDAYTADNVVTAGAAQSYCFDLAGDFGTTMVQVTAFSTDDAVRCAQSQCVNCSVTPCG